MLKTIAFGLMLIAILLGTMKAIYYIQQESYCHFQITNDVPYCYAYRHGGDWAAANKHWNEVKTSYPSYVVEAIDGRDDDESDDRDPGR